MVRRKLILKGIPASSGVAEGRALVIMEPREQVEVVDKRILVVPFTTPLFTQSIIESSGIITDKGSIMSHAAVIAREFGVPCVVGTEQATKKIENGMEVVVDGTRGYVYQR